MTYFPQIRISNTEPFGGVLTADAQFATGMSFHYNVNTELVAVTETNGGTVTQGSSMARLQTSTNVAGAAVVRSRYPARYVAGQGVIVRFSAMFTTGVADSTQEVGYGNATDGLFFGYNGATFGINRRSNGSDNWKAKAAWSEGVFAAFDPTKLNVYRIAFQWLGAGEIEFSIEDPDVGEFVVVHRIQYANSATTPSFFNPSLGTWGRAINAGNASNLSIYIPNAAVYTAGPPAAFYTRAAYRAALAYTTGAERVVIGIQNESSVFGGSSNNRAVVIPDYVTVSTDGTKSVIIRLSRCTLSGGTSGAVDTNTSTITQYTNAPTVGSARLIVPIEMAKVDQLAFPLDWLGLRLAPGEALVATAESTANSDVAVGFGWRELL